MKTKRIAISMLAAGLLAGALHAQADTYDPPGDRYGGEPYGQYDDDWRDSDNWYEAQENDGYDTGYEASGSYDPYDNDGGYGERGPAAREVGFFYGALSPYGEWVRHPYYGWVWFPRHVRAGWRPYSVGRWVVSDYGWTWISYERFGWATYHYGRWAWDRYVGWLWVPGTEWGPAWVAWQQGNGYIGWAPLPPAVGFDLRAGIQLGGFSLSFGIAPRNFAFVEERRFLDNRIGNYIVPEARNVTIIHNTTNVTHYTVVDNRVINRGVPVERVERASGRRAQRMRVATASAPTGTKVERDVVRIYRPPATQLESVKVGKRNNAGLRKQAAPAERRGEPGSVQKPAARPPGEEHKPRQGAGMPIQVAPRVPPASSKVNERDFAREQEELRARQQQQRQSLEKMQRRDTPEAAPPPTKGSAKQGARAASGNSGRDAARAEPQEIQKRHAAELEEQRVLRERTAVQLKNRQQLRRQAAEATAAERAKARGQEQEKVQPSKQKQAGKAKPTGATAEPKKQKDPKQKDPKNQNPKNQDDQKPPTGV